MAIADGLKEHTLMISLSRGIEQPWDLSQGSNRKVDFCIWVLQVDGLQFHPFTRHASVYWMSFQENIYRSAPA
ncbi:MAG: hypothetical protein AAFQ57_07575, partial [Cyanobacteria bacterium J06626_14]